MLGFTQQVLFERAMGLGQAVGSDTTLLYPALSSLGGKKSWETSVGVSAGRNTCEAASCPPGNCSLLLSLRSEFSSPSTLS